LLTPKEQGYAPLFSDFDSFYTRRLYQRIRDCWNRPITGVPGRHITVLERESKVVETKCLRRIENFFAGLQL